MTSCIFEGSVTHMRNKPIFHSFKYNIFMMYLNIDEIDDIFEKYLLWGTQKFSFARFRRSDHFGNESIPLNKSIRKLVFQETGKKIDGSIYLLTNLSYLGYCFNPVSFYYCYDSNEKLEVIIAEVTNTPWGETCCYVLTDNLTDFESNMKRFQPQKKMHVSPFMPMDIDYDWLFSNPCESLKVMMGNSKNKEKFFNVSMSLNRKKITSYSLARVLIKYPLMTFKVIFGIHFQALKLWIKRCPFYVHPAKRKIQP
jgi:DUF1365 family protein